MGDPTYVDQLSSDLRTEENLTYFRTQPTLSDAMRNLMSERGSSLRSVGTISELQGKVAAMEQTVKGAIKPLGSSATDDEKRAYLSAIGVPDSISGYGQSELEADERGKLLLDGFMKAGIRKDAVKPLNDFMQKFEEGASLSRKTASEAAMKEYLAPLGEKSKAHLELAQSGTKALFGDKHEEIWKEIEGRPEFIKAMSEVGKLTKERPGIMFQAGSGDRTRNRYPSMKGIDD